MCLEPINPHSELRRKSRQKRVWSSIQKQPEEWRARQARMLSVEKGRQDSLSSN